MDVKVFSLSELLGAFKAAMEPEPESPSVQATEELLGKLAGKFRDLSNHMDATRDAIDSWMEWSKKNNDLRGVLYLAQVHSNVNTIMHSSNISTEILEHYVHQLKHDRECSCVAKEASEAATESPKAENAGPVSSPSPDAAAQAASVSAE